jgi:hypothetical protein
MTNPLPERNFFDRAFEKRRQPWLWLFYLTLIVLDIWWDYYHPLGLLIDVILLLVLLRSHTNSRYYAERHGTSRYVLTNGVYGRLPRL